MDYTSDQLNGLLAEVEKEFKVHLAKAEQSFNLTKSEDAPKDAPKEKDEKKAASESKGESKNPMESEKPEDKGAKDQNQQAEAKPGQNDQAQPGAAKDAAPAPAAQDGAAPAAEGEDHGYDDEDMGHMQSMYGSMSRGELKAHHDCIRKCMDGMGLAKCEDGMVKSENGDAAKDAQGYRPNGGPKDGMAEAEGKGPASSDAQAMTKSERDMAISEVSLLKSELESVKAQSVEEKKNLEAALSKFLTKFVEKTAPAGKAIMSLDVIAKTENGQAAEKPLSKSEIDAKLLAKAKDFSLSKSDRDAINSYCCGNKDITKVSHLLK
jgi:hypothetical protein